MSSDFFVCDTCGCIDNIHATGQSGPGFECHFCRYGTWHGQFEQRPYNADTDIVLNRPNRRSEHPDLGEPSFS